MPRSRIASGLPLSLRAAALVLMLQAGALPAQDRDFTPPATPGQPVVETLHGVTLTDPYRWLENGKDPAVMAWTRAQHDAARAFLDRRAPPVPGLRDELTRIIDRDRTSPPQFRNGRVFFQRTLKGEPQAKLFTTIEGRDVLLFDPVALDPTGKTTIGAVTPSPDGSLVAVGAYLKGSEILEFRILDSRTGAQQGAPIVGVWGISWARDQRHVYISPRTAEGDAKQEPRRCYRHRLGSDRRDDELLMALTDPKRFCAVYEPEDTDLVVFQDGDFWSNRIRIQRGGGAGEPVTIFDSDKFRAFVEFRRDRFYARTNHDAPKWKLMTGRYDKPAFADWRTLLPEQKSVLEDVEVTSTAILALDRDDVLTRLTAFDPDGRRLRELPPPAFGNVSGLAYDLRTDTAYATLASHTVPLRAYALPGRTLAWDLVWADNPPVDTSALVAERLYVPAKDGEKIPVFVVRRKDATMNGDNPVLLHGYGGFNNAIDPFFIGTLSTFVSRGGIFVDAGIRGGSEYGETWHRQGMLESKQNSFDDFVAVAEWLIRERWTTPARLAIMGGSNGGLLVGAAITQRPDLFRAAVCQVPLLDMIRYPKFLIAPLWIPEYGDPEKPDAFAWLLRYSPYHNVRQGVNLPETLVIAGEYDSRVDPLHAKKFAARVQNNPGQVSPFLLYMDFDAGHGTGKTTQQRIDDYEYQMRFVMNVLGMNAAPAAR